MAVSLAEDSQADVYGHVDQGVTIAARGRGLVTLGLSKGSNAAIDGDVDQPVGGALLVALNLAKDGGAESNRNADQAVGGVDTLYQSVSALSIYIVEGSGPFLGLTEAEAARATREVMIDCFIVLKET